MSELTKDIPYVILEAYPDYKRPYVLPRFGFAKKNEVQSVILKELVEFVYDRIDIKCVKSEEDIQTFWDNYYSNSYMDMRPWEATAFINDTWCNISPSNEELLQELIMLKDKDKDD